MRNALYLSFLMLWLFVASTANGQQKKTPVAKTKKTKNAAATANTEKDATSIHWLTLSEAEAKMKEKPKKVYIHVYTSWCGWCKRMDATTFSNTV